MYVTLLTINTIKTQQGNVYHGLHYGRSNHLVCRNGCVHVLFQMLVFAMQYFYYYYC